MNANIHRRSEHHQRHDFQSDEGFRDRYEMRREEYVGRERVMIVALRSGGDVRSGTLQFDDYMKYRQLTSRIRTLPFFGFKGSGSEDISVHPDDISHVVFSYARAQ